MEQARESSDEWSRDQPPVGGHRGDGQARDGVNLVRLVSLVGWVCSSSAQKESKNSAATLTVDSLDTPSSTAHGRPALSGGRRAEIRSFATKNETLAGGVSSIVP